jgi:hypothetical protein
MKSWAGESVMISPELAMFPSVSMLAITQERMEIETWSCCSTEAKIVVYVAKGIRWNDNVGIVL